MWTCRASINLHPDTAEREVMKDLHTSRGQSVIYKSMALDGHGARPKHEERRSDHTRHLAILRFQSRCAHKLSKGEIHFEVRDSILLSNFEGSEPIDLVNRRE